MPALRSAYVQQVLGDSLGAAPDRARARRRHPGRRAVFAALARWLLAGDRIAPVGWLGVALMLLAVSYLASRTEA